MAYGKINKFIQYMIMQRIRLKEEISSIREQITAIKEDVKLNKRALTEEEEEKLASLREEISEKEKEVEELEKKAAEDAEEAKKEAEKKALEDKEKENETKECNRSLKTDKNINVNKMNKLQYRFNEAVKNREYNREISMNERNIQVTGEGGVHDAVIQEDFTDILEPLYANSILGKLGVRMRTNCVNDVHVPKQTKGTVGFLGEIEAASASNGGFDYVTLRPKRIGSYIDVSEQTLIQDSVGVFEALQKDLLKKMNEYIEQKFFDDQAATDVRPAGIFYNQTPTEVTDFAGICDLEADVEDNNVYGDMKYAMNPKAKAGFRQMIKGTNATGMVYEFGEMDGIPTEVSSAVPTKQFVYGNWDNILFCTWGDKVLKISDSATGLITGEVRVYLGAFIDWAVLRPEAFAFGEYKAQA